MVFSSLETLIFFMPCLEHKTSSKMRSPLWRGPKSPRCTVQPSTLTEGQLSRQRLGSLTTRIQIRALLFTSYAQHIWLLVLPVLSFISVMEIKGCGEGHLRCIEPGMAQGTHPAIGMTDRQPPSLFLSPWFLRREGLLF